MWEKTWEFYSTRQLNRIRLLPLPPRGAAAELPRPSAPARVFGARRRRCGLCWVSSPAAWSPERSAVASPTPHPAPGRRPDPTALSAPGKGFWAPRSPPAASVDGPRFLNTDSICGEIWECFEEPRVGCEPGSWASVSRFWKQGITFIRSGFSSHDA